MKYIDLTHTFHEQMSVFPGDPAAELVKTSDVAKDGITHYQIKTGMHVGTHMDAPAHMLEGGKNLDEYPPEKFFVHCVVIDARGKSSAGEELIAGVGIKKGDAVLVCFGWSEAFGQDEYYLNYPVISGELAKKLSDIGISIIGMDTPSPDKAPYEAHKIFFKNDILVIENLTNLESLLNHKNFELIALPAKFQAEAAPCRAVARI